MTTVAVRTHVITSGTRVAWRSTSASCRRSATCRAGYTVAGLRVTRAFQDWGDLDMYEFQLYCQDDEELRSGGGGSGGGGGVGLAKPPTASPTSV